VLTVSDDDFLWFVDLALDAMVAILRHLGDDKASLRPDLEGANSPYAILTHCLGVMEFWGGYMVAGRQIVRDRHAEFRAEGRVAHLVQRVTDARRQLEADIADMDPTAPPRHPCAAGDEERPDARTQGGVLLHILEELVQHLGQMEISRDVLDGRL
jgi:Protein of unknown function (DUF664)